MSTPEFQHIHLRMLDDDIVLVELLTRDLQGPSLAKELGVELNQVTHQNWANRLLINFQRVHLLSSTGFAVLFSLVRQVHQAGRLVKFCDMAPELRLGADVVGLGKVTEIYESQDAAIQAFASA